MSFGLYDNACAFRVFLWLNSQVRRDLPQWTTLFGQDSVILSDNGVLPFVLCEHPERSIDEPPDEKIVFVSPIQNGYESKAGMASLSHSTDAP